MPSTATDRIQGLSTSVAVKAPVRTVATTNITLSGLQTIGGVVLVVNDRVLVMGQTDSIQNGIYYAKTGAWVRCEDFDGSRDAVKGTLVVTAGHAPSVFYQVITDTGFVVGTDAVEFALVPGLNANYFPLREDEENYGLTVDDVNTSKDYHDFERHGGDPTGVAYSNVAMQRTIDINGYCTYRGLIKLQVPIMGRTGMQMLGEGNPLIFNDEATVMGSGLCIVLGTHDDGGFTDGNAVNRAINNVTIDDDHVTCTTAAHAAYYPEGTVIALGCSTGYTASGGYFKPKYQQLNVVHSSDAVTGIIKLRYPIYATMTGMWIYRAEDNLGHALNNFTPQMIRDFSIKGTRFGSLNDAWTRFGGHINGDIDITVEYGNSCFATNGAAYARVRVVGCTDVRSWELAYYCHNTHVYQGNARQCPDTTTAASLGLGGSFAEGAHHNVIEACEAQYFSSDSSLAAKFGQGSFHNTIRNVRVRAKKLAFGATVSNANPSDMMYGHNLIDGGVWDINEITGDLFDFGASAATDEVGIKVRKLKVICPTLGTRLYDFDGKNISIEDVDLRDCQTKPIVVSSGSSQIRIIRNRLPSAQVFTPLLAGNVDAQGCTIIGRESLESLRMDYSSASTINSTLSSNKPVSRTITGGSFAAGDSLEWVVAGLFAGTDAHNIQVDFDGSTVYSYSKTTAAAFLLRGITTLVDASTWETNVMEAIVGTDAVNSRTVLSKATSADGVLSLIAYVGNAASTIRLDTVQFRWVRRY